MSDAALSKKLLIKSGLRVRVLQAPEGFALELPEGATSTTRGGADVVLLFARDTASLSKGVPAAMEALEQGGVLWVAYPKISSGVKTDLTRDVGWSVLEEAGWGGVAIVSVDATWSALRFKKEDTVPRKAGSMAPGQRAATMAARRARPAPEVPQDLSQAVAADAKAAATWATLAPSHVREYVDWITEAKREETRTRRVAQAVEMLAQGARSRNEKYRSA